MRESWQLVTSVAVAFAGVALIGTLLQAAGDPLPPEPDPSHDDAAPTAPVPPPPDVSPPAPEEPRTDDEPAPAWGSQVDGLLRFRGDLVHGFHGRGPLPGDPQIEWRHPDSPMCIVERSTRQVEDEDGETTEVVEQREWCGTGWTGQPVVWERNDGVTEVIIGGFDGLVYFLDGDTGEQLREPFRTGFQIKGTGALDPDGYPLFTIGSRDGRLRVLALDRDPVEELWGLDAHPQRVWNNDWDGSPAIVDDLMLVGGEDSWFYAVKLNRTYEDGLVQVDPEVLVDYPGFNDELFQAVGDRNVSIENSVAVDVARNRVAFANSGGRVQVLALDALRRGDVEVEVDIWLGDDIDASIVIDPDDGAMYVAIELQRFLPRADEVGQIVRLDPDRPQDPIVWGVHVPPRRQGEDGGAWATPALHDGLLYAVTHPGELLVLDTDNGDVVFRDDLGWHSWSSPVIVHDDETDTTQLLVATCTDPHLRAYDLTDPRTPREQWRLGLPGCIESTPAVWDGRIWVGSRDGFFYGIR